MKIDEHETVVIFRKFKNTGGIVAIFPELCYPKYATKNNVMDYMHIGQHGECNYDTIMKMTYKAYANEYIDLFEELRDIGYNLKVMTKTEYEKRCIK